VLQASADLDIAVFWLYIMITQSIVLFTHVYLVSFRQK